MAAAAVPAISLGAQYFLNRGTSRRNAQNLAGATTGLQGSASSLGTLGQTLGTQAGSFLGDAQKTLMGAAGAYRAPGAYYGRILGGDRGAIDSVLSPDRAVITETYRGAGKALDRMPAGGGKDLAAAELNRDRAGKLALLPGQARANAAQGALQVGAGLQGVGATQSGTGSALSSQGVTARGAGASAYNALYGGAINQDQFAQTQNRGTGDAIGRMIFDSVQQSGKKPGGRAGAAAGAAPAGPAGSTGGGFWGGVTPPTFG